MEILQVPKARKLAEAYHDGSITLRKFMEQLEWCWDMKIHRGTKAPVVERGSIPSGILNRNRYVEGTLDRP
jgi:hypothetical protein